MAKSLRYSGFGIKRAIDVGGSVLFLVLFSPLLSLVAGLIKLETVGPVFFFQERIGRNFNPFEIIKFRTMVVDGRQADSCLTVAGDSRITRMGRFLRRFKIDELPQLVNVVKGEMSLVGPRPEVRKYVELKQSDYAVILTVRPGMTDPASLQYFDEEITLASAGDAEQEYVRRILPRKLELSKEYLRTASVGGDLWIIVKTLLILGRTSVAST